MKQRHRKHRRPVRPPVMERDMRRRIKHAALMADKYKWPVLALKKHLPGAMASFNEYNAGRNREARIEWLGREQYFNFGEGKVTADAVVSMVCRMRSLVDPIPKPA